MSCYATKLQLVPLCFHIFSLKFVWKWIGRDSQFAWQLHATGCKPTKCAVYISPLLIALLRQSGRVWDAVAVPTMLPDVWTRPQCLYTYWAIYGALIEHLWVNCSSVGHRPKSHNLQIYVQFAFPCLLFLEQYCIQIVYILCVYFFLWPLCSLCCTCVTIYFCLEYCSTQPEAEDVLFCAMGIHPSSSGFICIWPVWSFIFTSLKLAFPSLLSGSVPLNGLLGLLYEVQKKAFCGGYVHFWEYWQLNCQIYMKFGIGLYSLWL